MADVKKNYLQIISSILIVLLATCTFLLILQNYKLKSLIKELTNPPNISLSIGDKIGNFKAITLSGDTVSITFEDSAKPFLFFILSTTCPHCFNTLKYWNEERIG